MNSQTRWHWTVNRPSVKERVRLIGRDLDLAHVLVGHQAMRSSDYDTVSASLGGRDELSARVNRSRRQRHVGLGLIEVHRLLHGQKSIVVATPRAAQLVGFVGPVGMPAWGLLPHTLALSAVGAYFLRQGLDWVPELRLPRTEGRWMGRDHRPDGVLTKSDGDWAVEVELSTKSLERTSRVIEERAGRFAGLTYLCGDARVAAHIRRASDQRGLWAQDFPVEIRLLEEVINHG